MRSLSPFSLFFACLFTLGLLSSPVVASGLSVQECEGSDVSTCVQSEADCEQDCWDDYGDCLSDAQEAHTARLAEIADLEQRLKKFLEERHQSNLDRLEERVSDWLDHCNELWCDECDRWGYICWDYAECRSDADEWHANAVRQENSRHAAALDGLSDYIAQHRAEADAAFNAAADDCEEDRLDCLDACEDPDLDGNDR